MDIRFLRAERKFCHQNAYDITNNNLPDNIGQDRKGENEKINNNLCSDFGGQRCGEC